MYLPAHETRTKGNSPWDQILFTTATNRGHPSLKVFSPLYIVGRQSAIGLAILVTASLSLARVLCRSSEQFMKGTHSHQSSKTGNGTVTPHPWPRPPLPSGFGPYIAPAGRREYPSVVGGETGETDQKKAEPNLCQAFSGKWKFLCNTWESQEE